MKMITCLEASKIYGISARRMQQMCKNNEIKGAKKEGKSWVIPEEFLVLPTKGNPENSEIRALPIGVADYKDAVENYYYVDKTLFIKDILDALPKVSLFTRPRRFGKTLTMDMLRVFFEKTNQETSRYFNDKEIWKCGEKYREYQGKYPVIFLSFKDVKFSTWSDALEKVKELLSAECLRHIEILNGNITEVEKHYFNGIMKKEASEVELTSFLWMMSKLLSDYYKTPAVIIIDEYDTPIEQGYVKGYYDDVISFMRNLFSGGLKDNPYLAFGFMTGILRVAKESIFSGLNNVKINSILDEKYSQYFGFTKEEVREMLKYYGVDKKFSEVCSWYNGYKFGNTEIFNPWSVINYIDNKCVPRAFWQSTGSNEVIGEIVANATEDTLENLRKLLTGEHITTYIDTDIVYSNIYHHEYSIYSFLLLAGYLKVDKIYPQDNGGYICDVKIPNKEISYVYEKEILERTGKGSVAIEFQQAIFTRDIPRMQKCLEKLLLVSASTFDGTNEGFYHGMMLGLCAVVGSRYKVFSNKESGNGRFDIQLCPNQKNDPAFLFELKYVKNEGELDTMAKKALTQIEERQYDTDLIAKGILNIVKVGIAFCGKKTSVQSK